MPKIFIAADHAGFALKEELKPYIQSLAAEVVDCGAHELIEGDDYPDYVTPCARQVVENPGSFGIVIGASGEGEAMAANRVPKARAAVYYGEAARPQTDARGEVLGIIEGARAHNDANILALGARFLLVREAEDAVRRFITASFDGGRHQQRVEKLG